MRLTSIAKIVLFAAAFAGPMPWLEPAGAAQPHAATHIFTPHCAVPRPNCRVNVCARTGRCSPGGHGCLYYNFCKEKAH
jgi:hypothetical protein